MKNKSGPQNSRAYLTLSPWQPDVLGGNWIAQTLPLPKIRSAPVRATLVTTKTELQITRDTAVLYLHGYNDYFFHTHVGQYLNAHDLAFYALDLHGYGRSTLGDKDRNDCWSLTEYGPDLGAATRYLKEDRGYKNLVIMGHSTGGLLASLWAKSPLGRQTVTALILNSPWLDLNRPWFDRVIATAALDAIGGYLPDYALANDGSRYAHRLHESNGGQWNFNLDHKRSRPAPVRMGWLRAIRAGQARVHQGLGLEIPVLVLASTRTGSDNDNPDVSDTVLDVEQIIARAPQLGFDVTTVQIPQGIHDLALGSPASVEQYFKTITSWLRSVDLVTPRKD